jgi:hypothetical protein
MGLAETLSILESGIRNTEQRGLGPAHHSPSAGYIRKPQGCGVGEECILSPPVPTGPDNARASARSRLAGAALDARGCERLEGLFTKGDLAERFQQAARRDSGRR